MARRTRERPKGDPVAGPSRMRPLGDPAAEFRCVPANWILAVAE
jgi:hypothetical protein